MSITDEIQSRLRLSGVTHYQEDVHTVLGQRPRSQTVTSFFQKTNLSRESLRRSRSIGISASQRQEETTSNCLKEKTHRIPVLLPALSHASHSSFCVHNHPCCRKATETSSSTVEIRLCSSGTLPLEKNKEFHLTLSLKAPSQQKRRSLHLTTEERPSPAGNRAKM